MSSQDQKKRLVLNIVKFLKDELSENQLNEERKESVEVAIQCLEMAYDTAEIKDSDEYPPVNLLSLIPVRSSTARVTDQQKTQAEEYKTRGNESMKNQQFGEALTAYTKAIEINPGNAVYFCNRAAVYSKLGVHNDAIIDCKEAIRLDPTYGKAYGRLGIAYSNLSMYSDAHKAYSNALKYDPNNAMYESNLKLAEEKLLSQGQQQTVADPTIPIDLSRLINDPALIGMATQMLGDPNFTNIMSGFMHVNQTDNPNFDAFLQAGQMLANRMNEADPNFAENLRRTVNQAPQDPDQSQKDSVNGSQNKPES